MRTATAATLFLVGVTSGVVLVAAFRDVAPTSANGKPAERPPKAPKRMNFFKGFLTTEDDWNEDSRYFVEKHKLHNRLMHAPGVVVGQGGELKVRPLTGLSFEVRPGYAIDGQGNELVLSEPVVKTIDPKQFSLPGTIFIVLRYSEQLVDYIAYAENPEYKGYRRVEEYARVEVTQEEPDINHEVELARIHLGAAASAVTEAHDRNLPVANEIDVRFAPKTGPSSAPLGKGNEP